MGSRKHRIAGWLGSGGAIVFASLFIVGSLRQHQPRKVVAATLPVVKAAPPQPTPQPTPPPLLGTLTPVTEALVYAPITGSVAKRHHDAGDLVKKGDLLVVIEAPNNDREIQQARAAVAEADEQATRARQELDSARKAEEQARAGWERYRVLFSHGAVARQEVDRLHESLRGATASTSAAQDNLAAAEQNLEATRAKLNRLTGREPLEYVRAPFSGVITSRNCDSGAVVDAGSELFRMAEIATLRILVNAAFLNAQSIRAGQRATVLVSEVPNAAFAGTVVRAFAKEMEVEVPNPDRKLLPGMHGQVRIENGPVDNKENP